MIDLVAIFNNIQPITDLPDFFVSDLWTGTGVWRTSNLSINLTSTFLSAARVPRSSDRLMIND